MSNIKIRKISITELDTDAIVNAANDKLLAGGGVCGAIFKAAGALKLQAACLKIGHCDTGKAVITDGFKLKAKYIIHAVGPIWVDGQHKEPLRLRSAYWHSLELARDNGCHSVGFPLISAGIYGYPLESAWKIAIRACNNFLAENPDFEMDIIFAVLSDKIIQVGEKVLSEISTPDKVAVRSNWETQNMPEKNAEFYLDREFTPEQMNALRHGHIPRAMEDRWFCYMENNTLFVHRSWTGFCIYVVTFSQDGHHQVVVNRDENQYKCTSVDEDLDTLDRLLERWSKN